MALKSLITEEFTRQEEKKIEQIVRNEFDKIQPDIEKIIREMIEDDKSEKYIHSKIADSLEKYHQTLWQRRNQWSGAIRRQ